jgi:annexin A7/11
MTVLNMLQTIKREASGNFKYALLTILEYAVDPTKHYATVSSH